MFGEAYDVVNENDDLLLITNTGTIIRTPAKDISTYSRTASGVITMRLLEGQSVANITKVAREEESEDTTYQPSNSNTDSLEYYSSEEI